MWKKRILCLVLVLCAALAMTACTQKETFPTNPQQEETTVQTQTEQNIFGDTPLNKDVDFDDGSYDPSQEEGGDDEEVVVPAFADVPTPATTI